MPSQKTANREIERKYLLSGRPSGVDGARSVEVDQGYLPGDRINERVRRMRDADGAVTYFRTIKAGAGLERLEVEEETTQAFFETVWPLTRGARVHKRRHYVPGDGVTWEIDEFLDRGGLWLAEVELDHVERQVVVPDWLAGVVVREVTHEPAYTNHALAK
jgi:CYTH domain-containing protein